MRLKLIAVGALALLAGCATPPPPEPGSAASKVVAMGKTKNIVVGAMRVARENGYMTVNVQLSNTATTTRQCTTALPGWGLKAFRLPKRKPGRA
jgi:hypothetical protein